MEHLPVEQDRAGSIPVNGAQDSIVYGIGSEVFTLQDRVRVPVESRGDLTPPTASPIPPCLQARLVVDRTPDCLGQVPQPSEVDAGIPPGL